MFQLNKNGSFLERKKMFVRQPYHNMQSHWKVDEWQYQNPSPQHERREHRRMLEQAYIQKSYHDKMGPKQHNLQQVDTFRVFPDQQPPSPQQNQEELVVHLEKFKRRSPVNRHLSLPVIEKDKVLPNAPLYQLSTPYSVWEQPNEGLKSSIEPPKPQPQPALMDLYRYCAERAGHRNPQDESVAMPDHLTRFLRERPRARPHHLTLSLAAAKRKNMS